MLYEGCIWTTNAIKTGQINQQLFIASFWCQVIVDVRTKKTPLPPPPKDQEFLLFQFSYTNIASRCTFHCPFKIAVSWEKLSVLWLVDVVFMKTNTEEFNFLPVWTLSVLSWLSATPVKPFDVKMHKSRSISTSTLREQRAMRSSVLPWVSASSQPLTSELLLQFWHRKFVSCSPTAELYLKCQLLYLC